MSDDEEANQTHEGTGGQKPQREDFASWFMRRRQEVSKERNIDVNSLKLFNIDIEEAKRLDEKLRAEEEDEKSK